MRIGNIVQLGVKELWGLIRDPMLLILIIYAFTVSIYTASKAQPETLNLAALAIVDEDKSPVSARIITAFNPPYFTVPRLISQAEMDDRMDAGIDTFALNIPPKKADRSSRLRPDLADHKRLISPVRMGSRPYWNCSVWRSTGSIRSRMRLKNNLMADDRADHNLSSTSTNQRSPP